MKRISLLTLLLTTLCFRGAPARAERPDDDVPVAPIVPTLYEGWTNAYRLTNGDLDVVVVPGTGRIAYLAFGESGNLLRQDATLRGQSALPDAPDYWFNFGGDWFWPVAQSRWPDFQGEDWPPSRLLDGRPWQGRAWKAADGSACCVITLDYGEPLHLRASRFIKLHKGVPLLEVRQRLERVAPSDIPVTLWNITQVASPDLVLLPTDSDSIFEQGFTPLKFGVPSADTLTPCGEVAVYDPRQGGEHKLGTDSARAWIAARKGDVLIVEQATPHVEAAAYPDGGCTAELYANTGLGYAEIETLSPETALAPGETLENVLSLRCYQVPAGLDGCDLAAWAQERLGEKKVPEPAAPVR